MYPYTHKKCSLNFKIFKCISIGAFKQKRKDIFFLLRTNKYNFIFELYLFKEMSFDLFYFLIIWYTIKIINFTSSYVLF